MTKMFSQNDTTYEYDFNVTNTSVQSVDPTVIFGPQRDALYVVLPITVIYSLIFITGILGNTFTCIVIIRNKSMHTATNYYLFSLAVSDLLLLISGMPQEIYSIWSKWPYVFGNAFCVIRGLAAETSTNASVLTITLFTIERYLAICHPFQSHRMSKLSRAIKHVILLWIASFALALPQALQFGIREHRGVSMCLQTRVLIQHSFEISTFLFFFAPMILITVLYSLIGFHLNQTNIRQSNVANNQEHMMLRNSHKIRRKYSQSTRRVVKMLVAVVAAFFICWAPFHAQRLIAIYGTAENHLARSPAALFVYSVVTYSSGVFYYMSTCVNPILYHIMSNKFREAFKNTMLRCCRVGQHSVVQRRSYSTLAFQRHPTSSSTDNSGNSIKNSTTYFREGSKNQDKTNCIRHMKSSRSLNDNLRLKEQPCHSICKKKSETIFSRTYSHDEKNKMWKAFATQRPTVHKDPSIQDSISNSRLKESKKEDLDDELAAYLKEIKQRII